MFDSKEAFKSNCQLNSHESRPAIPSNENLNSQKKDGILKQSRFEHIKNDINKNKLFLLVIESLTSSIVVS